MKKFLYTKKVVDRFKAIKKAKKVAETNNKQKTRLDIEDKLAELELEREYYTYG